MLKNKFPIKNISGFMLLESIENVWNSHCIDSLSDKTKNSYSIFIKNLENEIALPAGDINEFQIYAVMNNAE